MSYSRGDYPYGDKNGVVQPLQHGEEGERSKLQQPVKLQPSWEENNLPEDELNFKNLTMDDASLQLNTPPDRYNLVYLTFLIHGIGVLMPWNMFITADKYFTEHKLSKEYTGESSPYVTNFMQYLTFAAQVPNVFFNWLNIFIQIGGNLTTRIVWSISIEVVVFIVTVILAMIDTSSWPVTFFWITILCVIVLNMANGIYQNTIFGMAAKLPGKYTGAVVLGSNISGTFTAVVSLLTTTMISNAKMAAIYYFITALFVLLVCFDTYFALPLNRFYRHHELREKKNAEQRKQINQGRTQRIPYLYILKKSLPQLYNVFFIFFVTLSIFPAIQANVKRSDENFFISDKYYSGVTCFLTFNLFAMIGSYLTSLFCWPGPKYLWIFVTLRVLYIPFFFFCNYQLNEVERHIPVYINNDWAYWIVAVTMGLTSGYFSSLAMIYTPRTVEDRYASTAGMFAAAALITGIFAGILSTFLWPWIITHVKY
ncbi:equilibrative nucleoside transporter 1 [Zophobas morio]|uniref:equilibrative nucleoside transporter 1 n=1 Tax=Zophobas morio TaxID=2755281 RepID=UPI0030832D35